MNAAQQEVGPLNADCMRLLNERDISAEWINPRTVGLVALHDSDGEFLFRVGLGISSRDLHSLLNVHHQRWEAGYRAGREAAFDQLRALLGAAKATA